MHQLTVKELRDELNELVLAGFGNKFCICADDEEGNAYHGIWYSVTSDPKQVKENIECSNGLYDSQETDCNNLVIIG